jgi:ParB-like nuclease domain
MRNIHLSEIRIDGGTQPREAIDLDTVDEYAEAMGELAEFPPLVVYHDGVHTWLADGFHRYHAAKKAPVPLQSFDVDWREGTLDEAKLYAASANAEHGKRRTAGDRRRAIEMVWSTEQGRRWPQKKIAEHCHVTQGYVSRVLGGNITENTPPARERKRAVVTAAVAATPEASHREVARKTGVDRETVAKIRAEQPSVPARQDDKSASDSTELSPLAQLKAGLNRTHFDGIRQMISLIQMALDLPAPLSKPARGIIQALLDGVDYE